MKYLNCILISSFLLFAATQANAEKVKEFESELFPYPCEVKYKYSHVNYVPPRELLDIGRLLHRFYTETEEYKNRKPGKMQKIPKKIIEGTNGFIKKAFAMSGDKAFYKLKVHSGLMACK